MRSFSALAFFTGLGATALVATMAQFGVLDAAEARSVDWRFQFARSSAEPLSDQVALVAIDDGSFHLLGKWPWPRRVLAEAIGELARAGARTVALDLLLSESDPDSGGDAVLASALRGVRAVVGIDVGRRVVLAEIWTSREGARELEALLGVLETMIDIGPAEAAAAANLTGPRASAFLAAPLEFKSLAIWRTIWRLENNGQPPALDDLVLALTGGRSRRAGADFDAIGRIDELWERAQSWSALSEELAGDRDPLDLPHGHLHEPPIPVLASSCAGAGVATSDGFDVDGAKRRTGVAWEVPGGLCVQFGIAAAAAHLGVDVDEIAVSKDLLAAGSARVPLRDGVLLINWPTSTFEGFPAVSAFASGQRPAISIAGLVSLARERAKLDRIERERDEARLALQESVPLLASEAMLAMPIDAFAVESDDAAMDDTLSEPQREAARRFLSAYQAVADGRARIDEASEKVRSMVAGRLVLVGWTATGALADQVATPLDPKTPGVFVHAAVADMVLQGRSRTEAPSWVDPTSTLLLGGIASLLCATLPTLGSTIGCLVIALGWVLLTTLWGFDSAHLLLPLVAPTAAPVASWATATAAVAVITARDRARVTRQFAARVSPQLVAQLARSPEALSVSGEEREITVMFGDLAGFTSIAESLGGPEVVRTLNRYLGALADALVQRGAYLNKFLGDGFMAFWSAFAPDPGQEVRAVEGALACQKVVRQLGATAAAGAPRISVRLGIATGLAVVGDCGAPPKLNDYTAIGDVVNLASRLESANKQLGTEILIDGATARAIERVGAIEGLRLRPLGRLIVVGQSVPIEVLEVVPASADPEWLAASLQAVKLFGERRLGESADAWRQFESTYGPSKVAQVYLAAIAAGDGAEDGVLRLRAK